MIWKVPLDRLAARRVRMLRRWIAANRCTVRPGLTHVWEPIMAVIDFSQWCPPEEHIGDRCTKCEVEMYN